MAKKPAKKQAAPTLLAGGNPQIAKGYGEGPVEAYLAAMPGWKQEIVRRIDALITSAVPNVRKAVKWNSPLYGADNDSYFLGFHCLTKYVKVAFFRGAMLKPLPPGESKQAEVRYLDIYEGPFDEEQFVEWVRQASGEAGVRM